MHEIKVSVIVPIYNVAPYLEKCLNTLCRQSLRQLEIIAVNDGSPDRSQEILEEFALRCPEQIRIFQKENGGLSDARNYGLKQARGEYVAFLDGDDYVDLDLYEALYRRAVETDADAVACPIRYVWQDGREKVVSHGFPSYGEGVALKKVFTRFYPAVWNKLYRRDLLEESGVLFKKGAYFEDVEFSHRLFPFFRRIASVELSCISYVQRQGSITASHDRKLFDYLTNMESITDFFKENGLLPFWKKELEYAASRYLLATFLKRASSLSDEAFEEALERSLAFLKEHFPHWKRNSYLIRNHLRGFYLLIFTPTLARLLRKRNQL